MFFKMNFLNKTRYDGALAQQGLPCIASPDKLAS